jgi:hypothetical protein
LADRLFWRRYVRGLGVAMLGGGCVYLVGSALGLELFADARKGGMFLLVWPLATLLAAGTLWWSVRQIWVPRTTAALVTLAAFIGWSYTSIVIGARQHAGNDMQPALVQLQHAMSRPETLVSLGRVNHRFAYSYGSPIQQLPWPSDPFHLPQGVEYFCYDLRPGYLDPPASGQRAEMSRPGTTAPLPFAWEKLGEFSCDPVRRDVPHNTVIVGRIRRQGQSAGPIVAQPASRPVPR